MRALMHLALVAFCLTSFAGATLAQNTAPADALVPAAAPTEPASPLPSPAPAPDADVPSAPPEMDMEAKVNHEFGKWVVGPAFKVFFFDVVFWDNDSAHNVVVPFVVLQLVTLAIVIFWPALATWLPAKIYGLH